MLLLHKGLSAAEGYRGFIAAFVEASTLLG